MVEPAGEDQGDVEPAREPKATRGRGEAARKPRTGGVRAAKVKGRTIYLPDDLFERIMVQAHRKDRTISEYVTAILEKQVPDYRSRDQGDAA